MPPLMHAAPLDVYLDTSDISRFADIGARDDRRSARVVYDFLKAWVDDGAIRVRFSGIHIAEITNSSHAELALRKAQVLEDLCRGSCFVSVPDVFRLEAWMAVDATLIGRATERHPDIRRQSNQWLSFDRPVLEDMNLRKMMKSEIKENASLNRKMRRALQARVWGAGRLRKGISAEPAEQELAQLAQRHSLNDVDQLYTIVYGYIRGEISSTAAESKFLSLLMRPAQVVRLVFELDHMRDANMAQIVRAFGGTLTNAIRDMRTQLETLSHAVRMVVSQRFPDVTVRKSAMNAAFQDDKCLKKRRISWQHAENIIASVAKGHLPAVDFLSEVARSYAVRHITMPRKPVHSDGGDILHLTYLPYCDLFRADTDVAEMVKRCAGGLGKRVVRKLEDLPQAVEERMAAIGRQEGAKIWGVFPP